METRTVESVADAQVEASAYQRLIAEERVRLEQEQAEAQRRESQAENRAFDQRWTAEKDAAEELAKVAPLYKERDRAAAEALAALEKFCAVDLRIVEQTAKAAAGVPHLRSGQVYQAGAIRAQQLWASLRQRAGLPDHRRLDLKPQGEAQIIGATALKAIVAGAVRAGVVRVGDRVLTLG